MAWLYNMGPGTDSLVTCFNAGRIQGDFKVSHDYRNRTRVASGAHGAVAADHGRCSDQGNCPGAKGKHVMLAMFLQSTLVQESIPGQNFCKEGHHAVALPACRWQSPS